MDIATLYSLYLAHPVVTTDSRHITPDCLFFALKGPSFDGNTFARQALDDGSAAAIVDDPSVVVPHDDRYVLVPNVLEALQQLAAERRRHFRGTVLQVTGTNGKTTTKELLRAVVAARYRVMATEGNLNNHIGVPLTLLRLSDDDEVAIVETGANHPGEIAALTDIVRPDLALITSVGHAHIEGFGSFEGVKRTKGELYDYMATTAKGRIFVNAGDANLAAMAMERNLLPPSLASCTQDASSRAVTYAAADAHIDADVVGAVSKATPLLSITWRRRGGEVHEVSTQLFGHYNLTNLLSAIAVGTYLGISEQAISQALAAYTPTLGRSELRQTAANTLICDAYNANPTSMRAAIDSFRELKHPHKMVILGDMRELGAASAAAHEAVLQSLQGAGIEAAWVVGSEFEAALTRIGQPQGVAITAYADVEAVVQAIAATPITDRCILIKGSNGTRLHTLPALL